jgi:hypothetical protein
MTVRLTPAAVSHTQAQARRAAGSSSQWRRGSRSHEGIGGWLGSSDVAPARRACSRRSVRNGEPAGTVELTRESSAESKRIRRPGNSVSLRKRQRRAGGTPSM